MQSFLEEIFLLLRQPTRPMTPDTHKVDITLSDCLINWVLNLIIPILDTLNL